MNGSFSESRDSIPVPQTRHGLKGFTLIELLVVVAIIAILAAILLPALHRAKENAKRVACMNNVKQLITAVHLYAGDFNNYLPYGGRGTGSYWYQFNTLGGFGNCPTPHGLGMLLYNGYLANGRPYFCPSENTGVNFFTRHHRYVQYQNLYNVGDDRKSFQTLINLGTIEFMSAYCFRPVAAWGPYFAGAPPAHGPDPGTNGWCQLYTRLDLNRCGGGFCGGYHPTFALISDSFLFDLATGPLLPQGRFRHVTGYNVAYSDGHVRWVNDSKKVLSEQLPGYFTGGHTLNLTRVTEDVWNAFDSYAGYQYYTSPGWVMGLPKE